MVVLEVIAASIEATLGVIAIAIAALILEEGAAGTYD